MDTPPNGPEAAIPLDPIDEPNPGAAKTIGTLNIVFGSLLLLCGFCVGMQAMAQSVMAPMMAAQQQQMQAQIQASIELERQKQLKKLQDEEKATQDEKEKAKLQQDQKNLQAQPVPKPPDLSKFMNLPGLQGYLFTDVLTGLVLNIAMLISGIGVLSLKEWGRKSAVWVAGIKIIRLIVLYSYFVVAVVPPLLKQVRSMFEDMFKDMPPGPGGPSPQQLDQMISFLGIMYSACAIGMIVLGVIYPAIVLIVLTRPRVKAAFLYEADDRLE